jgi:hypothetical protein
MMVVYYQALEALREGGLKGILRPRFFWKTKATPVEMDLSAISSSAAILKDPSFQFIELKTGSLADGKFLFSVPSRGVKASRNLKRGWPGFALIKGNLVIGDVWCVAPSKDGVPVIHPDLAMLGVTCRNRESYAFERNFRRCRYLASWFTRRLDPLKRLLT